MMMRRLIQEIREHGTYQVHGMRGQYPEIFARRWNSYRDAMAEGYADRTIVLNFTSPEQIDPAGIVAMLLNKSKARN